MAELRTAGRVEAARAVIAQAETMMDEARPAMSESEEMYVYALLAEAMRHCGMTAEAVRVLERVCDLAVRLEPDSPQTVGDLADLAAGYTLMGKPAEALATWRRARPLCVQASPGHLRHLEAEIEALNAKLARPAEGQIRVRARCPSCNYSLAHAGLPLFTSLWIENTGTTQVRTLLRAAVPGFTAPMEPVAAELAPGQGTDLARDLRLNLVLDRLLAQNERASAGVEVYADGRLAAACETWVLPYGECSLEPGHELALACFVQPNNPAVRFVARRSREYLDSEDSFRKLRESSRPNRIDLVARAVHDSLAEYKLVYDYEPPCWETNSQRVRLPDEVIVDRTGTCLDLMLLAASTLENVLVGSAAQPMLVVVTTPGGGQHALIACWRDIPRSVDSVVTDQGRVAAWADSGDLFVMDSTGFTVGNPFGDRQTGFDACVRTGLELLSQARRVIAVDLAAARPDPRANRPGVTPLPDRREPAYGEGALAALWEARRAWAKAPTAGIQSAHLFLGLLTVDNGAAGQLFDSLASITSNPRLAASNIRAHLAAGLNHVAIASGGAPQETGGFAVAKTATRHETARMGAEMVDDLHLLFAALRHPGASVAKALRQLGISPAECLSQLERMVPAPDAAVRSEFPSEVHDDR